MARFARYLPEFAWDPIVLTVSPDALRERTDPGLLAKIPDGTRIVRTGLWLPADALGSVRKRPTGGPGDEDARGPGQSRAGVRRERPSGLTHRLVDVLLRTPDDKAWWFWPAVWTGLRVIRRESPSVILTTGPPHSTHLVGVALSRMTGVPLVLDFRDPWARTPWGPRKADPVAHRIVVRLERLAVRTAAGIVLNTTRLRDDFVSHYGREVAGRFAVVPNGYDPDLLTRVNELLARQPRLGAAREDVQVVHVGSLYKGRDPGPILEAIARLRAEGLGVAFRQVGSCASTFTPERDIERLGLNGAATFEGSVPHEVALARTAAADILLAIQPGTDLQIPGKIFEMMLFRKPIIGIVDEGATSDLLEQYRLGRAVRAGDVAGLAHAIRDIIEGGLNGGVHDRREAMQRFDGRRLSGELAAILDAVA